MSVAKEKTSDGEGSLYELIKVIVQALLIALVIRTFLFQPFNIPSASMVDTLLVGDYLFVSKYSYGYSRYSVPFGFIPMSGRVLASKPERGDVAVFKLPRDNATDYIKRVIGLPGDRIQVREGILYINDVAVPRRRLSDYVEVGANGREVRAERYEETLPNGVTYEVLDSSPNSLFDNTQVYTVPADHYFMMGDNRDNSTDSRSQSGVGYVPFENFVGRAEVIFFSIGEGTPIWQIWNWPWAVRWDRIFTTL
ncbi:signal peptidase I [Acuticoccus sediminis]|uniref:Signal peptidase I n=1 Tax=Acuticoccus sediminis TaxID=2184697 RepID=A0A8B2NDZ8_9HYPH|nr:signal peptidase I [Acuticoccus sediminis]RAH96999.1 signal peptidase I [Acuticoccus sediminis]